MRTFVDSTENGNVINRNSDLYHKAVLDLVGQENKIVLDFIGTLDAWQYYQFIVECFTLPEAKLANSRKDEQLMACIEVIRTRSTTRPYTILDYGAGKFRLWDCIKKEIPNKDKRTTILKYVAYEPYPDNSSIVDQDMILVTDNNELGKFARVFDLVFLLNVLHEIPVQNWLLTFQQIGYLLKDNGVLVIIEPTRLTRGEQPYGNNGYLVLGEEQIRQLFRDVLCFKVAGAKRSNCWIVNKKSLETITIEAVYRCINSLYASTGKALKKEFLHKIEMSTSREKADVEISSRHYAFLSQQYINAKFALETMQGN